MSRDFSKNLSNYMSLGAAQIGPLLAGASVVSFSSWVRPDTLEAALTLGDDVLAIQHTVVAVFPTLSSSTASVQGQGQFGGRRVNLDSRASRDGSTAFTTGVWQHFGGVMRFDGGYPDCYRNGALNNGTGRALTSSGTFTHTVGTGHDGIGASLGTSGPSVGTARMFDGLIAELALWTVELTAADMRSLGDGTCPLSIRPQGLVCYWPLNGQGSPEVELISRKVGTITGSIPVAAHPRIFH